MTKRTAPRRPRILSTDIVTFVSYPDASGAPAVIEVRQGPHSARFALDMLGAPTCNCLGSGLTTYMTSRAADAARRLYAAKVGELGPEWLARNADMYAE